MKLIDSTSANEEPVRMSLRTVADFADPEKIRDPTKPKPKTLTGYEMYLKKAL